MRSRDDILDDVEELIGTDVSNTANYHKTWSSESGKAAADARAELLPLLQEAAALRDIDLLLEIEQTFLDTELEHLVHTRQSLASFNLATRQIEAAFAMLEHVRVPADYRWAEAYFTLPTNLVKGLPKDEAHEFFGSHSARLGNALKIPPEASKATLLDARIDNLRLARDIYENLQRQALAVPEIHEPTSESYGAAPAAPEACKLALATPEIHEPTKPYWSERKLRLAA